MSTFTEDLDRITGGYNADHFLDDSEFDWAVRQMEGLGHDGERTAAAIRDWVASTPMWTCPECERSLDESYAECPICEVANPSVIWVTREDA